MKWETLYCPNRSCDHYGRPFDQGLLVKNGSSHGKKQALCRSCGRRVSLTYGTAYFDLEADPALFELTVRALAEGNSIQGTARIVQIDKDTVCAWLTRAAQQCRWVVLSHWRELTVTECQLDELWSFVHTKDQNLPTARQWCETYGDAWVWVAFAPEWRLVVAFVVGPRTQAQANLLLDRVVYVTDGRVPSFTSDQWPGYPTALLHAYGEWYQPERQGKRGRYPAPRCRPPPNLLYAQVVKRREKGRVVEVTRKIVWGSADALQARLAVSPTSTTINTSFVERDNLAWREHNRRLTRKTIAFSKELPWMEKQLWLSLAYYHFCLPHLSLREELPTPEPTRGHGSPRRWRPVTPAMAAGMTDHVWTTAELLGYRVPAPLLDTLDAIQHLFPALDDEAHHVN
jgi:IS1 family transposase/transposase-like protein